MCLLLKLPIFSTLIIIKRMNLRKVRLNSSRVLYLLLASERTATRLVLSRVNEYFLGPSCARPFVVFLLSVEFRWRKQIRVKTYVPEPTCSLFLLEKACSESLTITMPFYSKYSQTVIGFHDITIAATLLRKVLTPTNQLQALFALHLYKVASSVPQNYRGTFNQISVKTTVTCQTGSSLPNHYFLSPSKW